MAQLILLRHGQSQWNLENRFTGWTDIDLTAQGEQEARQAGQLLRDQGLLPDVAYTSVLKRAIRTLWLVLEETDRMWIPVTRDWRLNERHYGALQGLNKAETAQHYSEEQVHIWRRRYDALAPALAADDPRAPAQDPRYAGIDPGRLPLTESLQTTAARSIPSFTEQIWPALQQGRRVLVVAHGNSLRSLKMHLEQLSPAEIEQVNIPTGIPLLYDLDPQGQVRSVRYLGDPEAVAQAEKAVVAQGKAEKS